MNKIKFTLGLISVLAVLLFVVLTGVYFYLPHFLESKIIPQLAKESGISDLSVSARSIGIFGADLGVLQIGSEKNPTLIIRSVQIDYSPAGLYQKKIKKVTASGIELYCEMKNGEFGLRGMDLKKHLKQWQSGREKETVRKDDAPPIFVESLAIRNGTVIFDFNGVIYRVPFEIDVSVKNRALDNLTCTILTHFRDQEIRVSGDMDFAKQQMSLGLSAPYINLARFSDITEQIEGLAVSGVANLSGTAALKLVPFKISSANALITLKTSNIKYKNLHLRNLPDSQNGQLPFVCKIEGNGGKKWKLEASNIETVFPVPIRLNQISGTIEQNKSQIKGSGSLMMSMEPAKETDSMALPIRVMEPLHFPAYFSAELSDKQKWQVKVTTEPRKKALPKVARLKFNQFEIISKIPVINFTGTGSSNEIAATCTANVSNVQARTKDVNLFLPKIVLTGRADISPEKRALQKMVFELHSPDALMKRKPAQIKFNNVVVTGSIGRNGQGKFNIESDARLAKVGINSPNSRFQLTGVRMKLPLQWPAEYYRKKGSITVAAMHYGKLELGAVRADLNQTASGISFNGRMTSDLIPELSAKFTGNSDLFNSDNYETNMHFEISYPEAAPEINLERFLPAAKGFTFKGRFLEEGDLFIGKDGFSGTVRSILNNGRLANRQNKIEIEGIQMTLLVTELPTIRSAPGQQLIFSKATIGGLNVQEGQIDFQIESYRSVLIEKSHFKWCDGSVDTQSMRISSGVEDFRIIFYCDRLNLAKVLGQFGAAAAEGGGTVSGRIPMQYVNEKISFNDGFLFSSPGEGGKIYLRGTEILTAGVTPGTPQFVQMELAREALKDYDYSWAKLNITSEGEELLLQMQMDGKPAKSLPFVYSKEIGGFIKVEAGGKGSEFQGIRLDVNFRLPLNKMLQYKGLIKMIQ